MASLSFDHLTTTFQPKHAKAEQLFCDWLKSCGQLLAPNKIVIVSHFFARNAFYLFLNLFIFVSLLIPSFDNKLLSAVHENQKCKFCKHLFHKTTEIIVNGTIKDWEKQNRYYETKTKILVTTILFVFLCIFINSQQQQ